MRSPLVIIHVDHHHIELAADYKPDDLCALTIPRGFISDGASIPRFLWSLIGSPFHPTFMPAALCHDYLLSIMVDRTHKPAIDREFRRLLLANGVRKGRANLMYRAVRIFGKAGRKKRK